MSNQRKKELTVLGAVTLMLMSFIITFESNLLLPYKGILTVISCAVVSIVACTIIGAIEVKEKKQYLNKFKS